MNRATKVEDFDDFVWKGNAALYKLDPTLKITQDEGEIETEYIVVSSATTVVGPETCIFASDDEGNVVDFLELSGSFKGEGDHEKALNGAGYEIG